MSAFPASAPVSDIVARLRAAGCVFAEDEARLLIDAARSPAHLEEIVRRRVEGTPLEVIVGWVEFCGRRIAVDAGVFVPRQRSTFVVRQAVERARPGAVVVDLCCGAGALGAAIAAAVGGVRLHASDIEPAAVRCARRNLDAVGGRVYEGDLYDPLPLSLRGRVDILVANAPYVPTDEIAMMPPEARDHEPLVALDGGPDGVDVHRRVASGAPLWLAPGGHLLIETSEHQAPLTVAAMADHGLLPRVVTSDELYCTVVIGTKPAL
ncbi:methylase [Saccharothrix sp. ALI-22-I]|uniref:putative protein N(5)-glutamine methyltransferase n=1 Tax=Saccharothrix sp. ALI-22-I TaxID=1933778 RepID=UPI00097C878B|nr:putative protein N(5)-glutamine methyltransferase [Saccharothrix sp. ALI-22-I]ONI85104.1 methylase [Saccharothrix sp. ALI-22-I]